MTATKSPKPKWHEVDVRADVELCRNGTIYARFTRQSTGRHLAFVSISDLIRSHCSAHGYVTNREYVRDRCIHFRTALELADEIRAQRKGVE